MDINFELYKIFYKTAKLGSMSKAAKELFTSQPAISQSIKLLEEKLGGQLFHRTSQGVSLTSEGKEIYKYIEQSYGLIQTAERRFLDLKNLSSGQLRIAVSTTACNIFLLKYLEEFSIAYPQIKIFVNDQSTQKTIEELELGEVDIGIMNLKENNEAITIIKEIEIQDCFVANKKYKDICDKEISLNEMITYPVILMQKGLNTREFIDEYFLSYGLSILPQIELSTMEMLIEFAKRGLGLSCVIKDYVQKELKEYQLFEVTLKEKIPKRRLSIAINKRIPASTAAQAFIDLIVSK
ncbi:LysR family transcriptional regulator [Niallia taxi]|uniref:LysR family transcriptional regulator n=1 Tax=Niallia taxi TaxID=2499688 RepID=UPI00254E02E9|nr:LysR family transcriptional regulator [Niallia taxi]MDK8642179.1 LysR family transcriptional regulator [Niallia taxi]